MSNSLQSNKTNSGHGLRSLGGLGGVEVEWGEGK